MLPALGVEDSRPYYHYAPPDPAATPLFVANLPPWMRLHFQLDPVNGWTSPLVLDPATARFVCEAWADVPPRNMSPESRRPLCSRRGQRDFGYLLVNADGYIVGGERLGLRFVC